MSLVLATPSLFRPGGVLKSRSLGMCPQGLEKLDTDYILTFPLGRNHRPKIFSRHWAALEEEWYMIWKFSILGLFALSGCGGRSTGFLGPRQVTLMYGWLSKSIFLFWGMSAEKSFCHLALCAFSDTIFCAGFKSNQRCIQIGALNFWLLGKIDNLFKFKRGWFHSWSTKKIFF